MLDKAALLCAAAAAAATASAMLARAAPRQPAHCAVPPEAPAEVAAPSVVPARQRHHTSRDASSRNGACEAAPLSARALPLLVVVAAAVGWSLAVAPQSGAAALTTPARDALSAAAAAAPAAPSFRFTPGVTPLSLPRAPAAAVALYFATLAAARRAVAARGASFDAQLQHVVFAHNVLLCALSAALLAALAGALLPEFAAAGGGRAGLMRVWCDPAPHALAAHRVGLVFYANYLTKYYELLDTLLLVLRGRPTPALHVFHHAATLVLCWTQLVDDTACQWVPIGLNLVVHVCMYLYYAQATLGQRVWWKRHLTSAQIVQFAVDVPACAAALALRVNAERGWGWFGGAATFCRGTHRAAYVGIGLLAIYLVLFIKLYIDTYVTNKRCGGGLAAPRRGRAGAGGTKLRAKAA